MAFEGGDNLHRGQLSSGIELDGRDRSVDLGRGLDQKGLQALAADAGLFGAAAGLGKGPGHAGDGAQGLMRRARGFLGGGGDLLHGAAELFGGGRRLRDAAGQFLSGGDHPVGGAHLARTRRADRPGRRLLGSLGPLVRRRSDHLPAGERRPLNQRHGPAPAATSRFHLRHRRPGARAQVAGPGTPPKPQRQAWP